jgi:hypothetical protein
MCQRDDLESVGSLLFFWCKWYKREVFVDVAGLCSIFGQCNVLLIVSCKFVILNLITIFLKTHNIKRIYSMNFKLCTCLKFCICFADINHLLRKWRHRVISHLPCLLILKSAVCIFPYSFC